MILDPYTAVQGVSLWEILNMRSAGGSSEGGGYLFSMVENFQYKYIGLIWKDLHLSLHTLFCKYYFRALFVLCCSWDPQVQLGGM